MGDKFLLKKTKFVFSTAENAALEFMALANENPSETIGALNSVRRTSCPRSWNAPSRDLTGRRHSLIFAFMGVDSRFDHEVTSAAASGRQDNRAHPFDSEA